MCIQSYVYIKVMCTHVHTWKNPPLTVIMAEECVSNVYTVLLQNVWRMCSSEEFVLPKNAWRMCIQSYVHIKVMCTHVNTWKSLFLIVIMAEECVRNVYTVLLQNIWKICSSEECVLLKFWRMYSSEECVENVYTVRARRVKAVPQEVGGWGRDPKKSTGRDWGMGSSNI